MLALPASPAYHGGRHVLEGATLRARVDEFLEAIGLVDAARRGRLTVHHVAKLLPYRDEPRPEITALINAQKQIEAKVK